jgi:hypothetical protein
VVNHTPVRTVREGGDGSVPHTGAPPSPESPTAADKIVRVLKAVAGSACQRCIDGATGLPSAEVTADLVAMGSTGQLSAKRALCSVCRTWTAVFHLKRGAVAHPPR